MVLLPPHRSSERNNSACLLRIAEVGRFVERANAYCHFSGRATGTDPRACAHLKKKFYYTAHESLTGIERNGVLYDGTRAYQTTVETDRRTNDDIVCTQSGVAWWLAGYTVRATGPIHF